MAQFLMQAVSNSNGQLYTWKAAAPDFDGEGFPGPGSAEYIAVVARLVEAAASPTIPASDTIGDVYTTADDGEGNPVAAWTPRDELAVPDPLNLFMDPAAGSGGNGTLARPFNTFDAAQTALTEGGTIWLKPEELEEEEESAYGAIEPAVTKRLTLRAFVPPGTGAAGSVSFYTPSITFGNATVAAEKMLRLDGVQVATVALGEGAGVEVRASGRVNGNITNGDGSGVVGCSGGSIGGNIAAQAIWFDRSQWDGSAISCTGASSTVDFKDSEFNGSDPVITFEDAENPGTLRIDAFSKYWFDNAGGTVDNGTVEIIASAPLPLRAPHGSVFLQGADEDTGAWEDKILWGNDGENDDVLTVTNLDGSYVRYVANFGHEFATSGLKFGVYGTRIFIAESLNQTARTSAYTPGSGEGAWWSFNYEGGAGVLPKFSNASLSFDLGPVEPLTSSSSENNNLSVSHLGKFNRFSHSSAKLLVQDDSDVSFPHGTVINCQYTGSGSLTVQEDTSVTVTPSPTGMTLAVLPGGCFTLRKVANNTWIVYGALVPEEL